MSRYTDVGTIPLRSTSEEELFQEMVARAREETLLSDIIGAMMGEGELPEGVTGWGDLLGMQPLGLRSGIGPEQKMIREVFTNRLMQMLAQEEQMKQGRYSLAAQYSAATKPATYATQKPQDTKWYDKFIGGLATSAGPKIVDIAGDWGGNILKDLATSGWESLKGSKAEPTSYYNPADFEPYGKYADTQVYKPGYGAYEPPPQSTYPTQDYYFESAPTYSMSTDPSIWGYGGMSDIYNVT